MVLLLMRRWSTDRCAHAVLGECIKFNEASDLTGGVYIRLQAASPFISMRFSLRNMPSLSIAILH